MIAAWRASSWVIFPPPIAYLRRTGRPGRLRRRADDGAEASHLGEQPRSQRSDFAARPADGNTSSPYWPEASLRILGGRATRFPSSLLARLCVSESHTSSSYPTRGKGRMRRPSLHGKFPSVTVSADVFRAPHNGLGLGSGNPPWRSHRTAGGACRHAGPLQPLGEPGPPHDGTRHPAPGQLGARLGARYLRRRGQDAGRRTVRRARFSIEATSRTPEPARTAGRSSRSMCPVRRWTPRAGWSRDCQLPNGLTVKAAIGEVSAKIVRLLDRRQGPDLEDAVAHLAAWFPSPW